MFESRQHDVLAWYRFDNIFCDGGFTGIRARDLVGMSPVRTSEFLVVLELDSRQTLVVRAGDTDHGRHESSQRIDPAIALVQHDSWYIELAQCVIFLDANLLLQVDEA